MGCSSFVIRFVLSTYNHYDSSFIQYLWFLFHYLLIIASCVSFICHYCVFMIYFDVLWPLLPEVQTQVEGEARAVCDPDLLYGLLFLIHGVLSIIHLSLCIIHFHYQSLSYCSIFMVYHPLSWFVMYHSFIIMMPLLFIMTCSGVCFRKSRPTSRRRPSPRRPGLLSSSLYVIYHQLIMIQCPWFIVHRLRFLIMYCSLTGIVYYLWMIVRLFGTRPGTWMFVDSLFFILIHCLSFIAYCRFIITIIENLSIVFNEVLWPLQSSLVKIYLKFIMTFRPRWRRKLFGTRLPGTCFFKKTYLSFFIHCSLVIIDHLSFSSH